MISIQEIKEAFEINLEEGTLRWKKRPSRKIPAGVDAGSTTPKNYRKVMYKRRTLFVHCIIWAVANGSWPKGQIDHINGDRSDNRISNLRDTTPSENQKNKGIGQNNTSGVIGVHWSRERGKWVSSITVGSKVKNLGRYYKFEDAVQARRDAERFYGFHQNHGKRRATPDPKPSRSANPPSRPNSLAANG